MLWSLVKYFYFYLYYSLRNRIHGNIYRKVRDWPQPGDVTGVPSVW